jgi:cyclic pyranopterin phosphate synthase
VSRLPDGTNGTLLDRRGRPLRDLRVSVTDRCNFRCGYCMPREHFGKGHAFLPRSELLSFEEIARFAGIAAARGVTKVRLTGGEPLLRNELARLVALLVRIRCSPSEGTHPAHDTLEVALTTNGSLLSRYAGALASAGLSRLTVSLDALDPEAFQRMTDAAYTPSDVLAGIAAAEAAGFARLKINTVVRRGVNDAEILPLARHFRGSGHVLRFIEYMDVGTTNGWSTGDVMSAREIVERIASEYPLAPLVANASGEVARRYRYLDGGGEIGVISSVTEPFCGDCTRLRLSSEGKLYTCLFASLGTDVKERLRSGASDAELSALLDTLWSRREDRYSELRGDGRRRLPRIEMSYIGG